MKTVLCVLLFIFCLQLVNGKSVPLDNSKKVEIIQKGKKSFIYKQDGSRIKMGTLMKELKTNEACSESMEIYNKHYTNYLILTVAGLVTFPLGYLILSPFIFSQIYKMQAAMKEAVVAYNENLDGSQGQIELELLYGQLLVVN